MKFPPRVIASLVPVALLLGACAPNDNEAPSDDDIRLMLEPAAGGSCYEPPAGRNGLKPSQFWSDTAQTAYRDIQHQSLKNGSVLVGTEWIPVLNAPTGSDFYTLLRTYEDAGKYLIECALDKTQVVRFIYPDPADPSLTVEEDIHGWFGLAPEWMDMPIDTRIDLQEWVTGCMLARLNFDGLSVNILLEGDTPAIQTNAALGPVMPYEESTLRGNMFNSKKPITNSTPAFDAYLCRENHLASVCTSDGGAGYINNRICDDAPNICGLVDLGYCDPVRPGSLGACVPGGPQHWKCREGTSSTIYQFRTVGVQLEFPISQADCD